MLNRMGMRYFLSRPLRRSAPSVLAVRVEFCTARPTPVLARVSASTNPAACVFFCRRFDRHSSSTSSSSNSPSSVGQSKSGMRETSPLTGSSTTESSRLSDEEHGEATTDELPTESMSWKERAKTFAVEYGRVGIATHMVLSVVSISAIYAVISSGVDVTGLLHSLGVSTESAGQDAAAKSAGSFILAYAVYKVAAPLRWPLTFAVTPVVMRALRRRGYMLPKTKTNAHRSPRPDAETTSDHSDSRK